MFSFIFKMNKKKILGGAFRRASLTAQRLNVVTKPHNIKVVTYSQDIIPRVKSYALPTKYTFFYSTFLKKNVKTFLLQRSYKGNGQYSSDNFLSDSEENDNQFIRKIDHHLPNIDLLEISQSNKIPSTILQKVKTLLPLWIPVVLNRKVLNIGVYLNLEDAFEKGFQWFFYEPIGGFVERVLNKTLQQQNLKKEFQHLFLEFQKPYEGFLNKNRVIDSNEFGVTRLFFKKQTLIRLIRLLVDIYQPHLSLFLKKRKLGFFFIKKLLELTFRSGSYKYINALVNAIDFQDADLASFNFKKIYLVDAEIVFPSAPSPFLPIYPLFKYFLLGSFLSILVLRKLYPTVNIDCLPQPHNLMSFVLTEKQPVLACSNLIGGYSPPFAALNMGDKKILTGGNTHNKTKKKIPKVMTTTSTAQNIKTSRSVVGSRSTTVPVKAYGGTKLPRFNPRNYQSVNVYTPRISSPDKLSINNINEEITEENTVIFLIQELSKNPSTGLVDKIKPLQVHYKWVKQPNPFYLDLEPKQGNTDKDKENDKEIYVLQLTALPSREPLLQYLLKHTSLGQESEFRPGVITRNFEIPLYVIDLMGEKNIEVSFCTPYQETTYSNKCVKKCLDESIEKMKSCEYAHEYKAKSSDLNFSKNEAAHLIPEKMDQIMGRYHDHETSCITNSLVNGQGTFDSMEVSATDYQSSKSVEELIGKNLKKGVQKTLVKLSEYYTKNKEVNSFALSIIADLAAETYTEGRFMVAKKYCEDLEYHSGLNLLLKTSPELKHLLPLFAPKFYLFQTQIDHCKTNITIMQKHTSKLLEHSQTDLGQSRQKKGYIYHDLVNQITLDKEGTITLKAKNNLKKLMNQYDLAIKEYQGATQSIQAMIRFGYINTVTFAYAVGIPPAYIEKFVTQIITNSFYTANPTEILNLDTSLLKNVNLESIQRYYSHMRNYGNFISLTLGNINSDLQQTKNYLNCQKEKIESWLNDQATIENLMTTGKMKQKDVQSLKGFCDLLEKVNNDIQSGLIEPVKDQLLLCRFSQKELKKINNIQMSDALAEKYQKLVKPKEISLLLEGYSKNFSQIQAFLQIEHQTSDNSNTIIQTKTNIEQFFKDVQQGPYAQEAYNAAKRVLKDGLQTRRIFTSIKKDDVDLFEDEMQEMEETIENAQTRDRRQESSPAALQAIPSPQPTWYNNPPIKQIEEESFTQKKQRSVSEAKPLLLEGKKK